MLFSGRGGRVRCALVLCDRPRRLRQQRRAADFAGQKGYRSFLSASTNLRFSSFYNIKQHKPDYNRACVVAEVAGFEPTHAGIKIPCLTAWRHLYIIQFKRQRWQGTLRRHFFDRPWRCPKKLPCSRLRSSICFATRLLRRTYACGNQNPVPYRLATPLCYSI